MSICELSEKEIAEKILMALDKRESMSIESARKYDWSSIVDLTEAFYEGSISWE